MLQASAFVSSNVTFLLTVLKHLATGYYFLRKTESGRDKFHEVVDLILTKIAPKHKYMCLSTKH